MQNYFSTRQYSKVYFALLIFSVFAVLIAFSNTAIAGNVEVNLNKCRDKSVPSIGRVEACTKVFADELSASAELGKALFSRATAYKELRNFDHAILDYSHILEFWPHAASAFHNRGNIHRIRGNYKDALKDYNEAIHLKPDHVKAIANRGVTFEKLNRKSEAEVDFQRAYDLGMRNKLLREKMVAHGLQYKE